MNDIGSQSGESSGGESYDGEVRDIGPDPSKGLHEYWEEAVRLAADNTPPERAAEWYTLETFVYVKHTNPGWVDGFRIKLTDSGSG